MQSLFDLEWHRSILKEKLETKSFTSRMFLLKYDVKIFAETGKFECLGNDAMRWIDVRLLWFNKIRLVIFSFHLQYESLLLNIGKSWFERLQAD